MLIKWCLSVRLAKRGTVFQERVSCRVRVPRSNLFPSANQIQASSDL